MSRRNVLAVAALLAVVLVAVLFVLPRVYREQSIWMPSDYQKLITEGRFDVIHERMTWTNYKDRISAVQALSTSDAPEAYELLVEATKAKEFVVRLAIAQSLEKMPGERAQSLTRILEADTESAVRDSAKDFLGRNAPRERGDP